MMMIGGATFHLSAQIYRMGAGLCFGTGYQYNSSEMGNPGIQDENLDST